MGEQNVQQDARSRDHRLFMKCLLRDIQALDWMITEGMIESEVRRIGAEQEVFLVDETWRPAPVAMECLEKISQPEFVTEIGRFNLELNLAPIVFGGDCLSRLEHRLDELLLNARGVAKSFGADITLTGILPTIRKSDLGLDNLTPKPRYFALNDALNKLRRGAYELYIKGTDELHIKHDSVMLEACCTSFQVHFQVVPSEFANLYNLAQVVTAPLLAVAANSPLLFGRRLWKETRISVFQQAMDTRSASYHLRERCPRVSFGRRWVKESVLELFREDISRFRVILSAHSAEDPFVKLNRGEAPELHAFRVYNGTIYRWNRPCYGIVDGKPHLRIENRVIPSGPTVLDEVANAAFFFGLMSALSRKHRDITEVMEFDDAKANFLAAARLGLDAQFTWLGGNVIPAKELIFQQLLPLAQRGLKDVGIVSSDVDRYLGVLQDRVSTGRTGAAWLLCSYSKLRRRGTRAQSLRALTAATVKRQWEGSPVHQWTWAKPDEGRAMEDVDLRVEEIMTTDLFTVHPDESIDLVAHLMDWRHIRHVPVEDESGKLVGLVSSFEVLRHFGRRETGLAREPKAIHAFINQDPVTVPPETPLVDTIELMRKERVDCLPVVKEGRLIGIVTEHDFMNLVARLIQQKQEEDAADA